MRKHSIWENVEDPGVVWPGEEKLVCAWSRQRGQSSNSTSGRNLFIVVLTARSRELQKNRFGLNRKNYLAKRQTENGFLGEDWGLLIGGIQTKLLIVSWSNHCFVLFSCLNPCYFHCNSDRPLLLCHLACSTLFILQLKCLFFHVIFLHFSRQRDGCSGSMHPVHLSFLYHPTTCHIPLSANFPFYITLIYM